jgi:hypothetical protein
MNERTQTPAAGALADAGANAYNMIVLTTPDELPRLSPKSGFEDRQGGAQTRMISVQGAARTG